MSRHKKIDELLVSGVESLDITVDTYWRIEAIYNDVAAFLAEFWNLDPTDGIVYPQGSVPLGTVTRQIHRNDEVDVDSVVLRFLSTDAITKVELKRTVGDGLKQYIGTDPTGEPELSEGKRCWTLKYDDMHLDALPAVPNPYSGTGSGIKITDKTMVRWLPSDPKAYQEWFFQQMAQEFEFRRSVVAKQMDVEQIPAPMIKTTLQQAVQLLKRHRDLYFVDHLDDRPASVIITTLAAKAYIGGTSLFEVLEYLTVRMPDYVKRESSGFVPLNPVESGENFADRLNREPGRAQMFFAWLEQAAQDFSAIARGVGLHGVIQKMSEVLGPRPADYAAEQLGRTAREARLSGQLRYGAGTGVLTSGGVASGRLVKPDHSFHGDTGARP